MSPSKNNLLVRFSIISFIIMAFLAVVIARVLKDRLDHNIELLQAHGKAMTAMMQNPMPSPSKMKPTNMTGDKMAHGAMNSKAMGHDKPSNAAMAHTTHTIGDNDPHSIPSLMRNVEELQFLTYGLVSIGFVVLYGSLVSTVWGAGEQSGVSKPPLRRPMPPLRRPMPPCKRPEMLPNPPAIPRANFS